MPVYEYRCGDCGHREEHTHSIQNVYNPRCAICGRWMRMIYTPVDVVYKGEGFAKKDRKKKEGK